jgi:hypothetical protein
MLFRERKDEWIIKNTKYVEYDDDQEKIEKKGRSLKKRVKMEEDEKTAKWW